MLPQRSPRLSPEALGSSQDPQDLPGLYVNTPGLHVIMKIGFQVWLPVHDRVQKSMPGHPPGSEIDPDASLVVPPGSQDRASWHCLDNRILYDYFLFPPGARTPIKIKQPYVVELMLLPVVTPAHVTSKRSKELHGAVCCSALRLIEDEAA